MSTPPKAMDPGRRPNVIVVMTDDQGAWAIGAAGNDEIITPNIDSLAADGVRFDRFFCASPVCSPARASFYSGLVPSAHGVHDWISARHVGADGLDFLADQRLLPEVLADSGYRCGLVGKWHLGANDRPRPGFVHWFAHQRGSSHYTDAPVVRNGELTSQPGYITDAFTEDACGFVRRETAANPDVPFFLALQYTAPHAPWKDEHPDRLTSLYDDCAFESCPQAEPHPWARFRSDGAPAEGEPDLRAALVGYYASITGIDQGVGRLLDTLDELGIRDNTLVIFTSDNGFSCGQHGFWGKGNGTSPQNVYDSSILVPFIASHPGRIPGGRVVSDLVSAYDVLSTVLDYVGIDEPAHPLSPGRSFAGILDDATDSPDKHERVVIGDEYGTTRMIRTTDWKYVRRYPHGPDELYHLASDRWERINLIDDPAQADRIRRMAREMAEWFARHSDPLHDARAVSVTGFGQVDNDFLPGAFNQAYGPGSPTASASKANRNP